MAIALFANLIKKKFIWSRLPASKSQIQMVRLAVYPETIASPSTCKNSLQKPNYRFSSTPTQKLLKQLLVFLHLYYHSKSQFLSLSVYLFVPEIEPILGSYGQSGQHAFWTMPNLKSSKDFKLPQIFFCKQKIGLFHLLVLEILPILESREQSSHAHY